MNQRPLEEERIYFTPYNSSSSEAVRTGCQAGQAAGGGADAEAGKKTAS